MFDIVIVLSDRIIVLLKFEDNDVCKYCYYLIV